MSKKERNIEKGWSASKNAIYNIVKNKKTES